MLSVSVTLCGCYLNDLISFSIRCNPLFVEGYLRAPSGNPQNSITKVLDYRQHKNIDFFFHEKAPYKCDRIRFKEWVDCTSSGFKITVSVDSLSWTLCTAAHRFFRSWINRICSGPQKAFLLVSNQLCQPGRSTIGWPILQTREHFGRRRRQWELSDLFVYAPYHEQTWREDSHCTCRGVHIRRGFIFSTYIKGKFGLSTGILAFLCTL